MGSDEYWRREFRASCLNCSRGAGEINEPRSECFFHRAGSCLERLLRWVSPGREANACFADGRFRDEFARRGTIAGGTDFWAAGANSAKIQRFADVSAALAKGRFSQ